MSNNIHIEYVRRCKYKEGHETYKTTHAVPMNSDSTLCGKELSPMWFIMSSAGLFFEDVTCKTCANKLKQIISPKKIIMKKEHKMTEEELNKLIGLEISVTIVSDEDPFRRVFCTIVGVEAGMLLAEGEFNQ